MQLEDDENVAVAVKIPKNDADFEVKNAFRKEIAMMTTIGPHPYIVRFALLRTAHGDSDSSLQHA